LVLYYFLIESCANVIFVNGYKPTTWETQKGNMTVLIDPLAPLQKRSRSYKFDNFLQQTILVTDNSYNNKQILVMEKTILGNLEWQYVFLVRFITASMSDPKVMVLTTYFYRHRFKLAASSPTQLRYKIPY
ncbi:unnamed protein product, partial [Brassica oleracea var. botrytis]